MAWLVMKVGKQVGNTTSFHPDCFDQLSQIPTIPHQDNLSMQLRLGHVQSYFRMRGRSKFNE
jgi:hypothetical protein